MAGLTADGFVAKTLEEIKAAFEARQRADIDPALDTEQEGLIGQLNGIYASALAELWELAEALHDAMDPDKATGASQDALYSLTNTLRLPATKSSVIATVTLAAATNIAAGLAQASVAGNPAAKFVNAEPMVNAGGSPASVPVRFEAVEAGPVIANPSTLTEIDTPVTGWTAITNADDAAVGSAIETDAAYRLRRIDELAAQGGGTAAGLRADLLQLPNVKAATVVENAGNVTVGTLPPHSIEVVVRSDPPTGDEAAIAASIWSNKPAGIGLYGTDTSQTVTDAEGYAHSVPFSRPALVSIYVALRLTTNLTFYLGDSATKQALIDAVENPAAPGYLDVGADVYAGRLVAAAMSLPGVINADARVSTATISDFATAPISVVIGQREQADLSVARITITAFP